MIRSTWIDILRTRGFGFDYDDRYTSVRCQIEAKIRYGLACWFAMHRKHQCWAQWITWAMDPESPFLDPWYCWDRDYGASRCSDDAARNGSCWCGKTWRKR